MPRETITSLQNSRLKRAAQLRDSRQRRQQRRFLVDGARELLRAWQAGVAWDEIFVCEPLCANKDSRHLLELLDASPVPRLDVPVAVMEKLAFGERAEGVVGVGLTQDRRLADFVLPSNPLIAVLEGVEKPGNLGAILRSADGAGVTGLIVVDGGADLYNPNVIRASLGTIFRLPVFSATVAETLDFLRREKLAMFAARLDTDTVYTSADLRGPTAILLGSEANGLSAAWSGADVCPIKLPMLGAADSLNVSATAAVLFYEALRQRTI